MNLPNNTYINKINCPDTYGQVYLILYNYTAVSGNIFDPGQTEMIEKPVLALKIMMDNGLLSYTAKKKGLKEFFIEALVQAFPQPKNRFVKGYDAVSVQGPLYFFSPPLLVFGLLVSEIAKEKELKLRNGLTVIGVSATSFWMS